MFRQHANMPEDAIAKLLEKYHYDADKIESFVDASSTYTALISLIAQNRIKKDDNHDTKLAERRDRYLTEFKKSTDYLKACRLDEKDEKVLNYSIKMITDIFNDKKAINNNLG